jgi:molecular chaperone DnaK
MASEPPRGSARPIEGAPVRPELSSDAPFGPKPARRSGHPDALPSAPDLDLEMPQSNPHLSAGPASGHLGAVVAEGDFFPDQRPSQITKGAAPVAMEAFQRGSAIATSDNAPLLIDVTPLSLRVETVGGYSDALIAANSPVPCEKARTFLTAADNQTMVVIRVAQGESARFAENTYLGELELSGLAPARRGETKILVTFELDADGILNVRAKDKDTARETTATMRLLGTSTDAAEVNAMMQRQQRHIVA